MDVFQDPRGPVAPADVLPEVVKDVVTLSGFGRAAKARDLGMQVFDLARHLELKDARGVDLPKRTGGDVESFVKGTKVKLDAPLPKRSSKGAGRAVFWTGALYQADLVVKLSELDEEQLNGTSKTDPVTWCDAISHTRSRVSAWLLDNASEYRRKLIRDVMTDAEVRTVLAAIEAEDVPAVVTDNDRRSKRLAAKKDSDEDSTDFSEPEDDGREVTIRTPAQLRRNRARARAGAGEGKGSEDGTPRLPKLTLDKYGLPDMDAAMELARSARDQGAPVPKVLFLDPLPGDPVTSDRELATACVTATTAAGVVAQVLRDVYVGDRALAYHLIELEDRAARLRKRKNRGVDDLPPGAVSTPPREFAGAGRATRGKSSLDQVTALHDALRRGDSVRSAVVSHMAGTTAAETDHAGMHFREAGGFGGSPLGGGYGFTAREGTKPHEPMGFRCLTAHARALMSEFQEDADDLVRSGNFTTATASKALDAGRVDEFMDMLINGDIVALDHDGRPVVGMPGTGAGPIRATGVKFHETDTKKLDLSVPAVHMLRAGGMLDVLLRDGMSAFCGRVAADVRLQHVGTVQEQQLRVLVRCKFSQVKLESLVKYGAFGTGGRLDGAMATELVTGADGTIKALGHQESKISIESRVDVERIINLFTSLYEIVFGAHTLSDMRMLNAEVNWLLDHRSPKDVLYRFDRTRHYMFQKLLSVTSVSEARALKWYETFSSHRVATEALTVFPHGRSTAVSTGATSGSKKARKGAGMSGAARKQLAAARVCFAWMEGRSCDGSCGYSHAIPSGGDAKAAKPKAAGRGSEKPNWRADN